MRLSNGWAGGGGDWARRARALLIGGCGPIICADQMSLRHVKMNTCPRLACIVDRLAAALPAAAVATALALGSAAHGQQDYKLEDGQWRQTTSHDPATPRGQIQQIRKQIAQEQYKQARVAAAQWIENYPNHPMLAEAYLLRGDAWVGQKRYYKALFDYEYIARVFPASQQYMTALEREYEIALLFAAGMKRVWLGMRIFPARVEAEELFIRVQERSPGSEVAEKASIALGDFYFSQSQMESAAQAYALFLENYPQSRFRQRAMLRQIQANLATFKGPHFDATGLAEAAERIKIFKEQYPVAAEQIGTQTLLVRVDESLALKQFYRARWYERVNQPVSARYVYQRLIEDYPQSVAAKAALKRLSQITPAPVTAVQDEEQPIESPLQIQDQPTPDPTDSPPAE